MASLARRRTGEAEESEESYFASVSDLMVGILFVFLLMLTVFALNFRDAESQQMVERARLLAAQAEAEHNRHEAERQQAEAQRQKAANTRLRDLLGTAVQQLERELEERAAARNEMLGALERTLSNKGVRVSIDEQSGIMRLKGDLLFASNSAKLEPGAQQTVRVLSDALAAIVPCYAVIADAGCTGERKPILEALLIEGHTDRQPITSANGRYRDNDQLSAERALAVFAELRRDQARLEALRNPDGQPLLGVGGYGERRPLSDALGSSDVDYARNRRIDLRFILSPRTSAELQILRAQIHDALEDRR